MLAWILKAPMQKAAQTLAQDRQKMYLLLEIMVPRSVWEIGTFKPIIQIGRLAGLAWILKAPLQKAAHTSAQLAESRCRCTRRRHALWYTMSASSIAVYLVRFPCSCMHAEPIGLLTDLDCPANECFTAACIQSNVAPVRRAFWLKLTG